MNEIYLLATTSAVNRAAYQQRQVQQIKQSDRAQENTVKILGYDSETGHYKVSNSAGQIFSARAISNSGALAKGSQVSLVTPVGGIPIIDAMPR
ncbi:hypothetical protein [Aulosira sp. FACHB-615]|uniref:hypothetical protein n=1 Tax=Aulosira sp. FACHB-615 TaxID=2692777 RepID=UPI00168288FE|nr:hypothetical protein [Aulosira sp. FACHB-615]MBD2489003.1 hypothetical protein [Aulosira sp. FACHB-615]